MWLENLSSAAKREGVNEMHYGDIGHGGVKPGAKQNIVNY
jgi:hypothetical protein